MMMWSKQSRRMDPISRSGTPFCQGERGAMGLSRIPKQAMSNDGAKRAIPVADQIVRRRTPGECFSDLARNPFRRWAPRPTYPDEFSASEPHYYKSIEQAERRLVRRTDPSPQCQAYGCGETSTSSGPAVHGA